MADRRPGQREDREQDVGPVAEDRVVIKVDDEVDAAYIALQHIGEGQAVQQIVVDDARLSGEVVLDLDGRGRLLGIELIGYRSLLEGKDA